MAWECTVSQNLTRRSALGILHYDALMDVIFRGEEKNYTGFITIDSFGSGTAFKKEKQSCFQNKTA